MLSRSASPLKILELLRDIYCLFLQGLDAEVYRRDVTYTSSQLCTERIKTSLSDSSLVVSSNLSFLVLSEVAVCLGTKTGDINLRM